MYTYQADNQTVGAGKAVICEKQSPPEFQHLLQPVCCFSISLSLVTNKWPRKLCFGAVLRNNIYLKKTVPYYAYEHFFFFGNVKYLCNNDEHVKMTAHSAKQSKAFLLSGRMLMTLEERVTRQNHKITQLISLLNINHRLLVWLEICVQYCLVSLVTHLLSVHILHDIWGALWYR